MTNNFINSVKGTYTLKIKGKNVPRFIKKLAHEKIEILSLKKINYNVVHIKIYKKDLEKVLNLKTIYEIDIIKMQGIIKLKKLSKTYRALIYSLIISLIILYILSNLIFNIEVIHTDNTYKVIRDEPHSLKAQRKAKQTLL